MNQTTVARVLQWLAGATGREVSCDRQELVDLLNDIRQLAYSGMQILERAKPAFVCVPVQRFCGECEPGYCGCSGGGSWSGITLPSWIHQATEIFQEGMSMPYVERWGVYEALGGARRNLFAFQDMGDTYVLERDTNCRTPFVLSMMATKCGKADQHVTINYLNEFDQKVKEKVLLRQGSWVTVGSKVKSILPSGVSLPLDLLGPVMVRAGDGESGADVAQWDPGVDVPTFRRIRLTGACHFGSNRTIAVKGVRRFTRLWDDSDIVEHDNRMAWAAGAHFVRSTDQSKMDQAEMANAAFKQNLFSSFLQSEALAEQSGKIMTIPIERTFNRLSRFQRR